MSCIENKVSATNNSFTQILKKILILCGTCEISFVTHVKDIRLFQAYLNLRNCIFVTTVFIMSSLACFKYPFDVFAFLCFRRFINMKHLQSLSGPSVWISVCAYNSQNTTQPNGSKIKINNRHRILVRDFEFYENLKLKIY